MRLFVSYRRADVGGHAGRLADRLVQRLGPKNVFRDVTDISAGRDFAAAIREALEGCDAALAVIGPGWLAAATPEGKVRLFEPDDYVRLELASVLARDLPVVPVLVGGAALPAAADLPEDLRPLAQRQAIVLHDETWHQDVENLLRSLRGERAAEPGPGRRRLGVAVGAVTIAAVVAIAWWQPWTAEPRGGTGDGASTTAVSGSTVSPSCPNPNGPGWTKLTPAQNATAQLQYNNGPVVFTVRAAGWRPLEQGRWQVVVDISVANDSPTAFDNGTYQYKSIIVGQHFAPTCLETAQGVVGLGKAAEGRIGFVVSCEPSGRVDLVLSSGETRLSVTDAAEPSPC